MDDDVILAGSLTSKKNKLFGLEGADIFWAWDGMGFKKKSLDQIMDFNGKDGDIILIDDSDRDFKNITENSRFLSTNKRREFKRAFKENTDIIY